MNDKPTFFALPAGDPVAQDMLRQKLEAVRHSQDLYGLAIVNSDGEVLDPRGVTIPDNLEPTMEHVPSPFQIIEDFNQGLERKRFAEKLAAQAAHSRSEELRLARNKRKRRHRKERGK